MKRILAAVVLALFVATPLIAQTPWIHVAVDEAGENDTRVNVNLPLSVVKVAMRAAPESIISDGKLHFGHVDQDIDIESLREMWAELREAGDAEFVTVEEEDEIIRIRREGDFVRIDIEERGETNPEQVHVEIPVTVVDALFSGEGETLDLERAFDELSKERGDIVHIDDGETKVRIWIDEQD